MPADTRVTQRFLEENGLQLILRSHEGPDARYLITDSARNMKRGWCLDHDTAAGQLYTVFSAPDYPQFQASSAQPLQLAPGTRNAPGCGSQCWCRPVC